MGEDEGVFHGEGGDLDNQGHDEAGDSIDDQRVRKVLLGTGDGRLLDLRGTQAADILRPFADGLLSDADNAFLERFPECRTYLEKIRETERSYLSSLEVKGADGSDLHHLKNDIDTLLILRGIDALPIVLFHAIPMIEKTVQKSLEGSGMYQTESDRSFLLDSYIGRSLFVDPDVVRAQIRPILNAEPETTMSVVRDLLLSCQTMRQTLRVIDAPVHDGKFTFYGKAFELPEDVKESARTMSDSLEFGLILLKDSNGKLLRVLDLRPDEIDYTSRDTLKIQESLDLKDALMREIGPARDDSASSARVAIGEKDAISDERVKKFVATFEKFFKELDPSEVPATMERTTKDFLQRVERAKPQKDRTRLDWEALFGYDNKTVSSHIFSLKQKYALWSMLSPDATERVEENYVLTKSLIGLMDRNEALRFISLSGGDTEMLGDILLLHKRLVNDEVGRTVLRTHGLEESAATAEAARQIPDMILNLDANGRAFGTLLTKLSGGTREDIRRNTHVASSLTRILAKEALHNLAHCPIETLDAAVTFHVRAIVGMDLMLSYDFSAATGEDIKIPGKKEAHLEPPWVLDMRRLFPDCRVSNAMILLEYGARRVFVHRNVSKESEQQILEGFYKRVIALDVYHEKANAYTDLSGHEAQILSNSVIELREKGELPHRWTYMSIGCGDGIRVDKEMYERLKKEGKTRHGDESYYIPGRVIGIDMFDQLPKKRWEGMEFIQCAIERVPTEHPDLIGAADLVAIVGSPFNNMRLLTVQHEYFSAVSKLMKQNGLLIYETGSTETTPEVNSRLIRTIKFVDKIPDAQTGEVGINASYLQEGDDEARVGALFFDSVLMQILMEQAGFTMDVPFSDADGLNTILETVRSPDALWDMTKNEKGTVWTSPFWMSDAPSEKPKEFVDVSGRVFYTARKKGEPMGGGSGFDALSRVHQKVS